MTALRLGALRILAGEPVRALAPGLLDELPGRSRRRLGLLGSFAGEGEILR